MTDEGKQIYSLAGKRVWVNGHRGMAGSSLVRRLESEDCEILKSTSDELDLRRQADVEAWMETQKPDVVFLSAATVGGIIANETRPAEFIYDNLMIESNVIHGAWRTGVEKLLFLGSACIYPREAPQPMPEDCLLTGPLEPTERMVRHRQDRGDQAVSGLPQTIWRGFHFRPAHQPLWAGGQFRP